MLVRLAFSLALLASFCGWSAEGPLAQKPAAGQEKPNIIFILADDLGYGDLGCYGQTKIKTPNLDKMAAEGMRFTDAYAGSTVCAPSRCAFMTGLHTGHARIRGNKNVPLQATDRTVAALLRSAGYHTALIGKWGLGNENTPGAPQRQGFYEMFGYLDQTHAHDYYTDHLFRVDPEKGFAGFIEFPENANGRKGSYTHDLFTSAALNFVNLRRPTETNGFRPFFLFLAYTIPHANNELGRRTGNGMEVPSTAPYSDEDWPGPERAKAAMITRMDYDIGRLVDLLIDLKLDEQTLIVFTSDNGPHKEGGVDPEFFKSSGPLRGYKRSLTEGGIRVPLIARWPNKIKAGQVSNLPCAAWDFPATFAEVAKSPRAPAGDGISFAPTLLGKPQEQKHKYLYWEFHEGGFVQAIRAGDWKAIKGTNGVTSLYNLKTDLGEKTSVGDQNPKVVAEMEGLFKEARTPSADFPIPGEAPGKVRPGRWN